MKDFECTCNNFMPTKHDPQRQQTLCGNCGGWMSDMRRFSGRRLMFKVIDVLRRMEIYDEKSLT